MYPMDQDDTTMVHNVPTLTPSVSWVVSTSAYLDFEANLAVFYEFIFQVRFPLFGKYVLTK